MKHIFVDFEMCMVQKNAAPSHMHFEIIQFGAVALNDKLEKVGEFSRFVRPQYGELTHEIIRLTGIKPNMLAHQNTFIKVFMDFIKWIGEEDYTVYSWSSNDILQLRTEAKIKGVPRPKLALFDHWVDFQQIFTKAARLEHVTSLGRALELMQIEFVGSKHFADVDAYNTARLFRMCCKLKNFDIGASVDALSGSPHGIAADAGQEKEQEGTSGSSIGAGLSQEQLALLLGLNG